MPVDIPQIRLQHNPSACCSTLMEQLKSIIVELKKDGDVIPFKMNEIHTRKACWIVYSPDIPPKLKKTRYI